MISFGVGHSEVLDTSINELLSQLSFELRVASIDCGLGGHVVSVFDFFLFGLAEAIEVSLKAT